MITPFLYLLLTVFATPETEEAKIFKLINEYRIKNGKKSLAYCDSLTYVAKVHAEDLFLNFSIENKDCYLHSWSNNTKWTGGCIPQAGTQDWRIMWNKPKELTGMGAKGYEISLMYTPKETPCDATVVVKQWINSTGHRNCILEKGWPRPFKRMGVGIFRGVATVWFAE